MSFSLYFSLLVWKLYAEIIHRQNLTVASAWLASWLKIARPQKSSFNQLNWDSLTCVWTTMAEISNFVQKLWYLFHLKYKLNMIQCNNTSHILAMKTKNCLLLKVWGISIRSLLIKKAKMHLNYWTKIIILATVDER